MDLTIGKRKSAIGNARIIFVLGNLELGGAERQALILAKHLSEHEQARAVRDIAVFTDPSGNRHELFWGYIGGESPRVDEWVARHGERVRRHAGRFA